MSIRDQILEDLGGQPAKIQSSTIERVEQARALLRESEEELRGVGTAERLHNLIASCGRMLDISLPAIREEVEQGS